MTFKIVPTETSGDGVEEVSLAAALETLVAAARLAMLHIAIYPPKQALREACDKAEQLMKYHEACKHADIKIVKE